MSHIYTPQKTPTHPHPSQNRRTRHHPLLPHSVAEHIVHGTCTDEVAVDYEGPGIDFVTAVASYAHGGQVVVTGATWKAVADSIPLQCQVCIKVMDGFV